MKTLVASCGQTLKGFHKAKETLYQAVLFPGLLTELSPSPSEAGIIFSPSFTSEATKVHSQEVVQLGFKSGLLIQRPCLPEPCQVQ